MANDTEYQRRRWNQVVRQMNKLVNSNAPSSLLAGHLVTVIIPRLVSILGVQKDFAGLLAQMLSRQICAYTGHCMLCQKVDAVPGEECCSKCIAEIDQLDEQSKEFTEDEIP